jgi:hypothetical protein
MIVVSRVLMFRPSKVDSLTVKAFRCRHGRFAAPADVSEFPVVSRLTPCPTLP